MESKGGASRGQSRPGNWMFVVPAGVALAIAVVALVAALRAGWPGFSGVAFRSASGASLGDASAATLPVELQPVEELTGPFVVAVQAGHWQASGLPDELARLRSSTGASSHGIREVDVNLAVARELQRRLEARGWIALLVPATIPPGLRADAFVAIHADWGDSPSIRGWKIAPPWRPSPASLALAASLEASFAAQANAREDSGGVTIGMRGYYAFSYRRFEHAISPFTPAAIVELGFLTNPTDRELLADHPEYWAARLEDGIAGFLSGFDRGDTAALRPMLLPRLAAGPGGAMVFASPSSEGQLRWRLSAGSEVIAVDRREGWYEVFSREKRASGWVRVGELVAHT